MNQSHPKLGVIGVGTIGKIHLRALGAAGITVSALADTSKAALEAAAPLAPDAKHHTDWRDLLADPEVDAIVICTINSMHWQILKEVIASGKHVFCEKTMTVGAEQAREAVSAKLKPGQMVQIGYMKRFFPASQWAKDHFAEIGEPICATVRSFQGGLCDDGVFDSADWRPTKDGPSRTRQFASGGMLNMAGSHMLDMTAWLLGAPRSVTCRTWAPEGYDAELHAHALFEMERGTTVHFEAALSTYSKTGPYGNGWDELIQIDGKKGRLELIYPLWDRPEDFSAKARIYRESTGKWEEPEFPKVNAFQIEQEAFARRCRGEIAESPSIGEAAVVDCWIDACYQSAQRGGEKMPVQKL
ncbi:MAG: Gfo/Idh/MocA family oxidoreductase [Chthoniobacteraceae bacterium]